MKGIRTLRALGFVAPKPVLTAEKINMQIAMMVYPTSMLRRRPRYSRTKGLTVVPENKATENMTLMTNGFL